MLHLALAVVDLAALLLEQVGALVQLLVAAEEAPLQALELAALRPRLVLGLALQAQLLVLGLEDQVLLLGPGLGHDPAGLVLGGLQRLAGEQAACEETHGHADDARDDGRHGTEPSIFGSSPPAG